MLHMSRARELQVMVVMVYIVGHQNAVIVHKPFNGGAAVKSNSPGTI